MSKAIVLNMEWEAEIKECQDIISRHSYARTLDMNDFKVVETDDGNEVFYMGELVVTLGEGDVELGITLGDSNYDFYDSGDGVVWVHGIIHIYNEDGVLCNATSDDCIAINDH